MDNLTIEQRATRVREYMRLGVNRIVEMELRQAEHEGWVRGFADGHKQAKGFRDRHEPLIFWFGYVLGAMLMIVIFVK